MAYPTNPIYKLVTTASLADSNNQIVTHAQIQEGNVTMVFPLIEGNRYFDEYKIWCDKGNTAEAAD
tara:strand:- start:1 stop:198 length:198 start_codon:yes stop_codon:yes gene_type:complete